MYQKDLLHICHSLRRETIETKYDDNEIDNFFGISKIARIYKQPSKVYHKVS